MKAEAEKLVERCMDDFLFDNDLVGASPQAGDAIAGLVWGYIEEVIEEGELIEVDAIVEEACSRADAEIDDILERDLAEQQALADEEDECDA